MESLGQVSVTEQALIDAERLGVAFGAQAEERLRNFVKHSAKVTDPRGNRRFGDYVFLVKKGKLLKVQAMSSKACPDCLGTKKVKVFDVCPEYDGDGCDNCHDEGGRTEAIRHPNY